MIADTSTIDETRAGIRGFLEEQRNLGTFTPMVDGWVRGHSPAFSRSLGRDGWLGMTWPQSYGGREMSSSTRFVVIEELLAAGAPVAAHWIADRQTGPMILRFGTEAQRRSLLPRIARGELFVSIGLSEPDSGSDLASVRTRATRAASASGWSVTGRKIWTSHAHRNHLLVALVRTSPPTDDRHSGLSQMMIDLTAPGVEVRPLRLMGGEEHFTEIILEDVRVDDGMVLGSIGSGWEQINSELAYERSGPERLFTTFPLVSALLDGPIDASRDLRALGSVIARLWALRALSLTVQEALQQGSTAIVDAAVVKDLGTALEGEIIEVVRGLVPAGVSSVTGCGQVGSLLREALMTAPTLTVRGGTTEILRGIIAKG